jgi:hypothetical protein
MKDYQKAPHPKKMINKGDIVYYKKQPLLCLGVTEFNDFETYRFYDPTQCLFREDFYERDLGTASPTVKAKGHWVHTQLHLGTMENKRLSNCL